MVKKIQHTYKDVLVKCVCGNEFVTKSTYHGDILKIDICSSCHGFYTGSTNVIDREGRIDLFSKKFGSFL